MLQAQWCRYRLDFKFLARTSREAMRHKDTYFIKIYDSDDPGHVAIGECALFKGLSADDTPSFEDALSQVCADLSAPLPPMSAIRFGVESAMTSFRTVPSTPWIDGREGIVINGLVWMGDRDTMLARVEEKLSDGFRVIKLKIGGIAFDDELSIIKAIRKRFSPHDLEIRLDANASFTTENALSRLERLYPYGIHSLEQPIRAGQPDEMAAVCRNSPIDIALDEELIGYRTDEDMEALLSHIAPAYIILKPALCGGLEKSDRWISIAESQGIGWWATSALESNIGLYAIARWLSAKSPSMPQGLGTGELYYNNITSPLERCGEKLYYRPEKGWQIPDMPWRQ